MALDDHRLYLMLHHIIFDGVSIYRILMPELAAIYDALAGGEPIPLQEPTLQYGDYALWRQQHLRSPAVARQLAYWKAAARRQAPLLHLPIDRPRPAQASHRGAMVCFSLAAATISALRGVSRNHGVTLTRRFSPALRHCFFATAASRISSWVGSPTPAAGRSSSR